MNRMYKHFSKKWGLEEPTVHSIFLMIDGTGQFGKPRYGKTSKALKDMGLSLSPRQLRYFYRRIKLEVRISIEKKGKPQNYRDLVRNAT